MSTRPRPDGGNMGNLGLGITLGIIGLVGLLLVVACGGPALTSPKSSSRPPADTKETSAFLGMPVNQITLNSDNCRYAFARAREYVNLEWDLDDGDYVFMKLTYNDNFWNENRKLSQGALEAVLDEYRDRIMETCSSNGRGNR